MDYGVVRRGSVGVPRYNVRLFGVEVHQGPSRAVLSRFWVFRVFPIFYRFGACSQLLQVSAPVSMLQNLSFASRAPRRTGGSASLTSGERGPPV